MRGRGPRGVGRAAGGAVAGDGSAVGSLIGEVVEQERRLVGLRLRLVRVADEQREADKVAASGTDAWLAALTGSSRATMAGGVWLSRALGERYPVVRTAFACGETWMTLHDDGDGTWAGRFVLPDLHAHLLRTVLEHLSSPRRLGRGRAGQRVVDESVPCDLNWSERLGAARLDSGTEISAGEARRLACGAGLIPAGLGGASVPLDLGRESRLPTKAQRAAWSAIHDTCAAEGCRRPFAWTEIHHPIPWSHGGRTDLDNAIPLCGWHHRRAHDPDYQHTTLPTGEVRYRRAERTRHVRGEPQPPGKVRQTLVQVA